VAETIIDGVAGLKALVGKELGRTRWREMTFEAIVKFADATGDHQWIHVDRERIARESPFGKPVAHGYFTLSLIGGLFSELVESKNFAMRPSRWRGKKGPPARPSWLCVSCRQPDEAPTPKRPFLLVLFSRVSRH